MAEENAPLVQFGYEGITEGYDTPGSFASGVPGLNATIPNVAKSLLGPHSAGYERDSANYVFNNLTTNSHGKPLTVRDNFLNLLDDWQFSIPLNQLWMVFFDVPPLVTDEAMGAYGEHIVPPQQNSSINLARNELLPNGNLSRDKYMKTIGCAFAQTVKLPQEQNAIKKIGPTNRGFVKAPVLEQRQQFASINIEFLETNISFVDFLIRPWIVLSSHLGYVARPNVSLNTDIILVNFAKAGTNFNFKQPGQDTYPQGYDPTQDKVHIENDRSFIARKMYIFSGAAPINTAPERYGYETDANVDRRDTEWMFKRYQILNPEEFSSAMNWYDEVDTMFDHAKSKTFWAEHEKRRNTEFKYSKGSAPGKGFDILDILGL